MSAWAIRGESGNDDDAIDGRTTVPGTDIPVLSADIGGSGPVYSHFEQWDALREQCPAFWNDVGEGHWVLTRFDSARKALQQVETFSTDSTIISDPNPEYMLLPLFLDPSLHVKYRQLYNARFSPGAVDRLTPMARRSAARRSSRSSTAATAT